MIVRRSGIGNVLVCMSLEKKCCDGLKLSVKTMSGFQKSTRLYSRTDDHSVQNRHNELKGDTMKKSLLIAASLLLPASLFAADVQVNVSINGSSHQDYDDHNYYDEAEYVDDGDPWFEDCPDQGESRVSIEYQWVFNGPNRVLRCRQVNFHAVNSAWWFGPWSVKVGYCHHSCRQHHKHVYYHGPVRSTNWVRNHDHGRHFYEYRHPKVYHRGHPKVYRHEYKPRYHGHHNNGYQGPKGNHGKGHNDGNGDNHQDKYRHDDRNKDGHHGHSQNSIHGRTNYTPSNKHYSSSQNGMYKVKAEDQNYQKPSRNKNSDNVTYKINSKDTYQSSNNNNQNIYQVSGRERIR